MANFANKFLKTLNENEEDEYVSDEPGEDQEAFNASLDPNTPEGTFDDVPSNPVAEFEAGQKENAVNVLSTWVGNVEGFIEQLNGLDGSILSDVSRSESKKISRIAQDLSSLGESLKQYLMTAQNKQTDANDI